MEFMIHNIDAFDQKDQIKEKMKLITEIEYKGSKVKVYLSSPESVKSSGKNNKRCICPN